uniref:Semaphorin 7A (JohnMiltonHagen blood group) n=1 Tax=Hippocampus comes TaxID=109280 RepID=A0A3Q2YDB7_HIPCM
GTGISPFTYTQNSLSLRVGMLNAASCVFLQEPTFVSASWVKRKEDPENEKIYIFFREKNSDQNPEADPWISRVARVCKTDEGGSKRFFQNTWTSFLKARLVCGFPEESLYFNRLQDIYVQHAEDWRDTRVYALFTSSWNATAVCIYSMETIEGIFNNSTFKGYDKAIPEPRPGTVSTILDRLLPLATVSVVRDHPEMSDWVHSVHYVNPFYVSNENYTKIVVDRVQAADQSVYSVLLLATGMSCLLHNNRLKKLVASFAEEISVVDLRSCYEYNKSCADCVLARDPYCSWTPSGCTPTVPVCSASTSVNRSRRNAASPLDKDLLTLHAVPMGVPFYLSCPIDSYHAVYTWKHEDQSSPCLQMRSNCLLLIPAMNHASYGTYECVSEERDYVKVVKGYHLTEQGGPRRNSERGKASAVAAQTLWITLGLSLIPFLN